MRTTQLSDKKMIMSILSLAQVRGIDQNERIPQLAYPGRRRAF